MRRSRHESRVRSASGSEPIGGLRLHLNENTAAARRAVLEALRGIDAGRDRPLSRLRPRDRGLPAYPRRRAGRGSSRRTAWTKRILGLSIAALCHRPATRRRAPAQAGEAIVVGAGVRHVSARAPPPWAAASCRCCRTRISAFRLESVLAAITPRTRIVFLTNPEQSDRPADSARRDPDRRRARCPPRRSCSLDEAYVGLLRRDVPRRARRLSQRGRSAGRSPRRTGLPGCGSACSIGHAGDARRRAPRRAAVYSVNAAAVRALPAALADREYVRTYVAEVEASRRLLVAACDRLG